MAMPKSVRFYILLLSCFTIFSAAGIILADLDERANQVLLRVDPPKGLSPVEHGVSSPVPTPEIQLNSQSEKENEGNEGKNGKDKSKVQVVLGVMSQCPDAIYCESVFDDVLNQVGDIVDMKLTFIGRIDDTEPIYGVTCKHGPNECRGNIHELCAMRTASTDSLSPEEQHELEVRGASRAYRYQDYPMIPETRPWSKWWEFVTCSGSFGRFEVGTERVTKRCAVSSGLYLDMDWSCIEGERGVELLKESVRATEELGIRNSCTVIINGKKRCVRDDEQWKECEDGLNGSVDDFVRIIKEEYENENENRME